MKNEYLFKSERLGFRNWKESDVKKLHKINSDEDIMEFFPSIPNLTQTNEFVEKMKIMYTENGYCYFSVDHLESQNFIGFIGIAIQNYESVVTPCTDIGWRLDKQYWNKGYATEGALRCLEYAFNDLKLKKIKSIAPEINLKSIEVMKKIGMKKITEFKHPLLKDYTRLEKCVCYEIDK